MRNLVFPPLLALLLVSTFVFCEGAVLAERANLKMTLKHANNAASMASLASINCTAVDFKGASLGAQAGGGATARTTFKDINLTTVIDTSSPILMQASTMREVLPSAEITFYKDGAAAPYERVMLTNVVITKIIIVGGDNRHEELTLAFEKINFSLPAGDAKPVSDAWNTDAVKGP